MRIVAVADTHLFTDELVVPDGDVFVHAGDLCQHGDLAELARAAAWIRGLPHRHKLVIAGNHDWALDPRSTELALARALFADVTYLEDAEATLDGVRFYGSPWQPEFHQWAFNVPRGAALAAVWARIPSGLDVLITHGPPHGIGDRTHPTRHVGCEDLRARVAVVAPRVHLFGHIHQDGGAWTIDDTLFANVTTWDGARAPTVIDFDPRTRSATPIVVPPRDSR